MLSPSKEHILRSSIRSIFVRIDRILFHSLAHVKATFLTYIILQLSWVSVLAQISYNAHPGHQAIDIEWKSDSEGFLFCHGALNDFAAWHISNSWLIINLDQTGEEIASESFTTPSSRFFDTFYAEGTTNVLLRDTASGDLTLHQFDADLMLETFVQPLDEAMVLLASESYEGGIATIQLPNGPYWMYPDSLLLRNYGAELELTHEVVISDPDFVPQQISWVNDRWILTGITSIEQGGSIEYMRTYEVNTGGELNLLFQTNTIDSFWSFEQEVLGDDLWIHANDVGYWPSFLADHEVHHFDLATEEHTIIENFSADTAWFLPGAVHADGSYWMPGTFPAFFNFDTWGNIWQFTSSGSAVEIDSWEGDYNRSTLFKATRKGQTMSACGMIRTENGITYPAIWLDGVVSIAEKENSAFVAPNPATEFIKVVSKNRVLAHEVINMSGRLVFSGDGCEINVGRLAPGIYLIRYSSATEMGVVQFAKI